MGVPEVASVSPIELKEMYKIKAHGDCLRLIQKCKEEAVKGKQYQSKGSSIKTLLATYREKRKNKKEYEPKVCAILITHLPAVLSSIKITLLTSANI